MEARVLNSKTIGDLSDKIEAEISKDFSPTLAFVFSSVDHDLEQLNKIGNKYNFQIFGSSTSGEIADNEIYESSIVLMLLDINTEYFKTFYRDLNSLSVEKAVKDVHAESKSLFNNPGIIVTASGISTDGEEIVNNVLNIFGEKVHLYGGLAGDDLVMKETYVFTNGKVSNQGILFLIIDNDKIEMNGIATSGWEAIGVEKLITKSTGNIVYEIDHQPALDIFAKYFEVDIDLEDSSDVVRSIGVKFPLQVMRDNRDPVLRAPLFGNKEDRSLVFAGSVPQGSKVKFCVPPTFEIIETTIDNLSKVKTNVPDADALILFSCAARKLTLGPMTENEIEGIQNLWNAPLVGYFTYGEIGNSSDGKSDFHNETCSLLLLRSKE